MFKLHPQLDADTIRIGQLELSEVLLMDNASLPWVILVPKRNNTMEWHSMNSNDQRQLHHESMLISDILMTEFMGDKLNIGSLGNLVPQLHLHHIVRFKDDPVWPQPVWGKLASNPYKIEQLKQRVERLQTRLSSQHGTHFESSPI